MQSRGALGTGSPTVTVIGREQAEVGLEYVTVGNRVPGDYFITSGCGESDITVHAGSYHLALQQAGIEMCNIITYSSILPGIAREVPKPPELTHGAVMETIMGTATAEAGRLATAGIMLGWLYDKAGGRRYGGLVCEYNGHDPEEQATAQLQASLEELYTAGYAGRFFMEEKQVIVRSFVPRKRFGTVLVALCFVSYLWPLIGRERASLLEMR